MPVQPKPDEKLAELNKKLEENPAIWGKLVFPHHFRVDSPLFHLKILVESMKNRFFAVAAPRGSAKSTLLTFLRPVHAIAYKKKRFILICSNTFAKASGALDTIKSEIKDNPIMRQYKIKLRKDAEGDSIFRHPNGFETRVLCKGAEQLGSVRGEKFGAYRPDLILVDDLEDDELCRNPERRRELKEVFDEALIPSADVQTCDITIIGTILHDDSLMAKLVSKEYYKEYRKLRYKALRPGKDGVEESLWPEKWSVDDLKKMQQDKPSVFAKEMQNDPVSGAMSVFSRDNFRYWTIENNDYFLFDDAGHIVSRGALRDCRAAIACDLAWEEKRVNDYSVILPAFLTPTSDILVEYYIAKKGMRPHEIAETLFSMESRLRALTGGNVPIGFEKAMLEKVVKHFLVQEMRRVNHYLSFVDIQWDGDKIKRIMTPLEPRYNQKTIYHRRNMGDLEYQLLRLPHGVNDDICDCLSSAVKMLKYPKKKGVSKEPDDMFMKLRQFAIDAKNPAKKDYIYGIKNKRYEIPFTKCPI